MKKIIFLTFSVFLVLTFLSCKSKPDNAPDELEAPVVEEQKTTEETEHSLPELGLKTMDGMESSVESQGNVVENKTVDNTAILESIEAARKNAIAAGAMENAKSQLDAIDSVYEELKVKETDITAEGNDLIGRYNTLSNYINAKSIKQKIDSNDFASFAQSNYDRGVEQLAVVETAYESEVVLNSDIMASADAAYSNFNTVIITAYKTKAREQRNLALNAKKDADGVKAGVSRKEEYNEAAKLFQDADSLYAMQSSEKALENYISSKELYVKLYNEVSEKRAAALKAIEDAKKRVAESAGIAEKADALTPIEEPIEGIEEEDTVLLEADNYENPDDAVIEITTSIEFEEDETEEAVLSESITTESEVPSESLEKDELSAIAPSVDSEEIQTEESAEAQEE